MSPHFLTIGNGSEFKIITYCTVVNDGMLLRSKYFLLQMGKDASGNDIFIAAFVHKVNGKTGSRNCHYYQCCTEMCPMSITVKKHNGRISRKGLVHVEDCLKTCKKMVVQAFMWNKIEGLLIKRAIWTYSDPCERALVAPDLSLAAFKAFYSSFEIVAESHEKAESVALTAHQYYKKAILEDWFSCYNFSPYILYGDQDFPLVGVTLIYALEFFLASEVGAAALVDSKDEVDEVLVWIDSQILNVDMKDEVEFVPDKALIVEKALEFSETGTNFTLEDLMEIDHCLAHSQAVDPTNMFDEAFTLVADFAFRSERYATVDKVASEPLSLINESVISPMKLEDTGIFYLANLNSFDAAVQDQVDLPIQNVSFEYFQCAPIVEIFDFDCENFL